MKSYSDRDPEHNFEVENKHNGFCDVTFWVNIGWNDAHDECACDVYRLANVAYRENLAEDVERNYEVWLAAAMAAENAVQVPSVEARLAAVEAATLDLMLGGGF